MDLRDELKTGLVAGIAGAILIDLFFFVLGLTSGVPLGEQASQNYLFIASAALGKAAYANPSSSIAIGVAMHLVVSIGWALGYVYLARTQRHLLERPWLSGLTFGLVVYIFMNVALIGAGLYHRPSVAGFEEGLVAHLVFFGLPIALIVSRTLRTA